MYAAAFATNRYQQSRDLYASPNQILLRLLNGAIGFVDEAIAPASPERRAICIARAGAIVDELLTPLHAAKDEPTVNVRRLYSFVRQRLVEATLKRDQKALQDAKKILQQLESMFNELIART